MGGQRPLTVLWQDLLELLVVGVEPGQTLQVDELLQRRVSESGTQKHSQPVFSAFVFAHMHLHIHTRDQALWLTFQPASAARLCPR